MILENPKLNYKNGLPFEAELIKVSTIVPHRHETELELVYCLEGTVHLESAEQKETLHGGQLHSIDFEDIHCLWSDDDNTTLVFHVDLSHLPEWEYLKHVYITCESLHMHPYQEHAMEQVKDIVLSLSYKYFSGAEISPEQSEKAVRKLVDLLLQYFNWFNYDNQDDYMNVELYERFHRVLAYCQENYNRKISISQLAEKENINRNYFSQFVGKTVFSSFSNMINFIRCYHAEYLLLTTDMPNAEIAYACGFSDPKYFYSAFKSTWGCTPSEHRQQYDEYYRECLANPKSKVTLSDKKSASVLKDFILKWHLTRTLC